MKGPAIGILTAFLAAVTGSAGAEVRSLTVGIAMNCPYGGLAA